MATVVDDELDKKSSDASVLRTRRGKPKPVTIPAPADNNHQLGPTELGVVVDPGHGDDPPVVTGYFITLDDNGKIDNYSSVSTALFLEKVNATGLPVYIKKGGRVFNGRVEPGGHGVIPLDPITPTGSLARSLSMPEDQQLLYIGRHLEHHAGVGQPVPKSHPSSAVTFVKPPRRRVTIPPVNFPNVPVNTASMVTPPESSTGSTTVISPTPVDGSSPVGTVEVPESASMPPQTSLPDDSSGSPKEVVVPPVGVQATGELPTLPAALSGQSPAKAAPTVTESTKVAADFRPGQDTHPPTGVEPMLQAEPALAATSVQPPVTAPNAQIPVAQYGRRPKRLGRTSRPPTASIASPTETRSPSSTKTSDPALPIKPDMLPGLPGNVSSSPVSTTQPSSPAPSGVRDHQQARRTIPDVPSSADSPSSDSVKPDTSASSAFGSETGESPGPQIQNVGRSSAHQLGQPPALSGADEIGNEPDKDGDERIDAAPVEPKPSVASESTPAGGGSEIVAQADEFPPSNKETTGQNQAGNEKIWTKELAKQKLEQLKATRRPAARDDVTEQSADNNQNEKGGLWGQAMSKANSFDNQNTKARAARFGTLRALRNVNTDGQTESKVELQAQALAKEFILQAQRRAWQGAQEFAEDTALSFADFFFFSGMVVTALYLTRWVGGNMFGPMLSKKVGGISIQLVPGYSFGDSLDLVRHMKFIFIGSMTLLVWGFTIMLLYYSTHWVDALILAIQAGWEVLHGLLKLKI